MTIKNRTFSMIISFFVVCTTNGMKLELYEPPLKDAATFVREFPLMTAKLACYMYHRCSEQEKSTIATDIKEKNETALLKRFQLISSTSFEQLKIDKIAEMFVYDFPIMTIDQAYSKYDAFHTRIKNAINILIDRNENDVFKERFNRTVHLPPDAQTIIFGSTRPLVICARRTIY